jgi:hypothetical protein
VFFAGTQLATIVCGAIAPSLLVVSVSVFSALTRLSTMNILNRVICLGTLLAIGIATLVVAQEDETEKKSAWSTIDLQFYGYIKLDAAYDTGLADPGNFVKWVDLEPMNPHDSQFSMTANQTRVGLRLTGRDDEQKSLLTRGRIEIDFYGGGAENKPNPMLRLAYIDLHWRKSGLRFVAGQAVDLISPLVPNTVNYSVQWWAGNIGYRRPQIQLIKELGLSENSKMLVAGAITRDIGSTDSILSGVDSGADAGVPGLQARVGWIVGTQRPKPISFGLSGHWSLESFEITEEGDHLDFDSWSANFDLQVPLTEKVTVKAEAYTGVNLAQYLGGIGQGVNLERNEEIGDTGGWISLDLGPFGDFTHHIGFTITDPDDENLEVGNRSFNSSVFWNGFYSFTEHIDFALELSYWSTEYLTLADGADSADSFRTQFAVIYAF